MMIYKKELLIWGGDIKTPKNDISNNTMNPFKNKCIKQSNKPGRFY